MLAAPIALHVGEHSALVGPEVISGAEEEDRELSDFMPKVLDVGGDVSGVLDLCRPPPERRPGVKAGTLQRHWDQTVLSIPVRSQLDPDDVSVPGLLPGPAVVAVPAAVGHGDVQAVRVKSRRTRLAAEQLTSCTAEKSTETKTTAVHSPPHGDQVSKSDSLLVQQMSGF